MFGYTACVGVCNLCNFNYFLSLLLNISFTASMWSIWESLADVLHQQRTHKEHRPNMLHLRGNSHRVFVCICLVEALHVHIFPCSFSNFLSFSPFELLVFDWKFRVIFSPYSHIATLYAVESCCNDVLSTFRVDVVFSMQKTSEPFRYTMSNVSSTFNNVAFIIKLFKHTLYMHDCSVWVWLLRRSKGNIVH